MLVACLLVLNSSWASAGADAHLTEEELQALAFAGMLRQNVQVCTSTVYHLGCYSCMSNTLGTKLWGMASLNVRQMAVYNVSLTIWPYIYMCMCVYLYICIFICIYICVRHMHKDALVAASHV